MQNNKQLENRKEKIRKLKSKSRMSNIQKEVLETTLKGGNKIIRK